MSTELCNAQNKLIAIQVRHPLRASYHVLTIAREADILKILQRLFGKHGETHLPWITAKKIFEVFGGSRQPIIMKAMRL